MPGGNSPYEPYRYVPPQRVWVLLRFGLKTGIDFAHFGLEPGMVLREVRESTNVFIVSTPNVREIWEFEMDFKKSFLLLFVI